MKQKSSDLQIEQLRALRTKGRSLRAAVATKGLALDAARERERNVKQAAIMADVFRYAPLDVGDEHKTGDRITDARFDFLMSDEDFEQRYLPLVRAKYRELYGLDYPVNYTPMYAEFERPYWNALKEYRMIAVEFLKIAGKTDEAEDLRKAINGILSPKIAEQLDKATEDFVTREVKYGEFVL